MRCLPLSQRFLRCFCVSYRPSLWRACPQCQHRLRPCRASSVSKTAVPIIAPPGDWNRIIARFYLCIASIKLQRPVRNHYIWHCWRWLSRRDRWCGFMGGSLFYRFCYPQNENLHPTRRGGPESRTDSSLSACLQPFPASFPRLSGVPYVSDCFQIPAGREVRPGPRFPPAVPRSGPARRRRIPSAPDPVSRRGSRPR